MKKKIVGFIFKFRSLEFHLKRNIDKKKYFLLPLQIRQDARGEEGTVEGTDPPEAQRFGNPE